jgi:hypothetical protein
MGYADRLTDMAAELALMKAEIATLRDHNAALAERAISLRDEFELEQKRCDRFFELAAWAACQVDGGPFDLTERTLIRRAAGEWRKRRLEAVKISLVTMPTGTSNDDDPKPAA